MRSSIILELTRVSTVQEKQRQSSISGTGNTCRYLKNIQKFPKIWFGYMKKEVRSEGEQLTMVWREMGKWEGKGDGGKKRGRRRGCGRGKRGEGRRDVNWVVNSEEVPSMILVVLPRYIVSVL